MKKIILIGNGFDLAHNMRTSYPDVFKFIKNQIIKQNENNINFKLIQGYISGKDITHTVVPLKWDRNDKIDEYIELCYDKNGNSLEFKSAKDYPDGISFYSTLFEKLNEEKWSDIEELYFTKLSSLAKNDSDINFILRINTEFLHFKNILHEYLVKEEEKIDLSKLPNKTNFQKLFKLKSSDLLNFKELDYSSLSIITFNYTSKILNHKIHYYNISNHAKINSIIHIHNQINDLDFIFGYGNDIHENYKYLLNSIHRDELLKNFKTFNYLKNNKLHSIYHELSKDRIIDLQIIGLSCGFSDKTLLKYLFT